MYIKYYIYIKNFDLFKKCHLVNNYILLFFLIQIVESKAYEKIEDEEDFFEPIDVDEVNCVNKKAFFKEINFLICFSFLLPNNEYRIRTQS